MVRAIIARNLRHSRLNAEFQPKRLKLALMGLNPQALASQGPEGLLPSRRYPEMRARDRHCAIGIVRQAVCDRQCTTLLPFWPLKFPALTADETRRRRGQVMSSNLLDNPKLFRHLVEDLPVGIYIVDRERRIRFWNRGAEHLTGHLAHGVVGRVLGVVAYALGRRGSTV